MLAINVRTAGQEFGVANNSLVFVQERWLSVDPRKWNEVLFDMDHDGGV